VLFQNIGGFMPDQDKIAQDTTAVVKSVTDFGVGIVNFAYSLTKGIVSGAASSLTKLEPVKDVQIGRAHV
jgi:hypothetical protein